MPDFDKFMVYCDESSVSERYTVIGCLVCLDTTAPKMAAHLEQLVKDHGGSSELKWTRASNFNFPLYREYSSVMFAAQSRKAAAFYALVVDNSTMNHRLYNEGDRELGFNKMLFQLLFKLVRAFRQRPRFYALLDHRTTRHAPERLRDMLNAKARRDLHITHSPYRDCRFCDSKAERIIQLVDILCGAIAYKMNGRDLSVSASTAKLRLLDHITRSAGVTSLSLPTPYPTRTPGFDIWHIDLTARARGAPRT